MKMDKNIEDALHDRGVNMREALPLLQIGKSGKPLLLRQQGYGRGVLD